eukprot:symbB.v1.2.025193.t1/scaffold2433.1/size79213/7
MQNFFLELYACLAALTLVLSLGSLLLAMFLSMELQNFLSACTVDLQRHVRRALKRDWPAQRSEEVVSSYERDKDALQAVLEDARRPAASPRPRMGEDIEKQPLLEKVDEKVKEEEEDEGDSMSYDARKLITFEVFRASTGTIWVKSSLWRSMGLLLLLALSTAVGCGVLVKEPEKLKTDEFSKLNGFLKAIVGLLLGFFLSSSVNRWYACASGFLELFNAIRALHMQLTAIGAPKERVHMCVRYCVVSAYSLHYSLSGQTLPKDERLQWRYAKFDAMCSDAKNLDEKSISTANLNKIYPHEKEILANVEDPSQTLWVWVTSLLTRMSSDGEIPPMPTPTYGKILGLADKAFGCLWMRIFLDQILRNMHHIGPSLLSRPTAASERCKVQSVSSHHTSMCKRLPCW